MHNKKVVEFQRFFGHGLLYVFNFSRPWTDFYNLLYRREKYFFQFFVFWRGPVYTVETIDARQGKRKRAAARRMFPRSYVYIIHMNCLSHLLNNSKLLIEFN